eukprot:TRINITY_DN15319_c0_g1_i1.p3 TRINITY_DN15319_c0_g1~~TRINITY_DN15319_c0_g1_i1.p3  ORF type:complete len:149 (+),score=41.55 TRINITY_DN15319_c0_g1_i1:116-562(+)
MYIFFFFNDTATTEIYTLHIVGSVRCVQETVSTQSTWDNNPILKYLQYHMIYILLRGSTTKPLEQNRKTTQLKTKVNQVLIFLTFKKDKLIIKMMEKLWKAEIPSLVGGIDKLIKAKSISNFKKNSLVFIQAEYKCPLNLQTKTHNLE